PHLLRRDWLGGQKQPSGPQRKCACGHTMSALHKLKEGGIAGEIGSTGSVRHQNQPTAATILTKTRFPRFIAPLTLFAPGRDPGLMRLSLPPLPAFRWLNSISVRTRIVVLALIPVVGFIANGLPYTSGEDAVAGAFDSAKRAATLAGASREFKIAV